MNTKPLILIVDDDLALVEELSRTFATDGFSVDTATNLAEAREACRRRTPTALITEMNLPDGRGVELVEEDGPIALMIGRDPSVGDVVEAVRLGAIDVIDKPIFAGHVAAIITKALTRTRRPIEVAHATEISPRPPIIGSSPALRQLVESLKLVTRATKATVLVQGESGTGKELIARAIHYDGERAKAPFLAVNCATLTENLLEAELFGYEKGAFTGALASGKKGLFDAADQGTLFLDEVGELAPSLQARLLRVLQEGTFKRVGGVADIRVDVRIIAATNRDLRNEVQEGRFRSDLYYRLNVVPIGVPPLRDRLGDIPELCEHFLTMLNRDLGRSIVGLAPDAHAKLEGYSWPGNVRELRNVCEYAAIVCEGDVIERRHLTIPDGDSLLPAGHDVLPIKDKSLRTMESELIKVVLNETRFNITRAANILGINRSTLYNKIKDYGLRQDRPKARQSV